MLPNDLLQLMRPAEQGNSEIVDLIFVRNQADCAQTDLGFTLEPVSKLHRRVAGAAQSRFVFAPKNATGQDRRKIVMGEEERDIEPWNEVEQEHARNECVFRRDQIKHEQSDARRRLPKTEPMRTEEFILQEKIFRAAECFESQSENKDAAVNAVSVPSQRAARRIKRHHDPDAEPEKRGDDNDLAKQEEAVESFRPLRDHVYLTATAMRVRDGRAPSTRGKIPGFMSFRFRPPWRASYVNDLGIILPATLTPQPWITGTCLISFLAGLTWLYVVCSEQLGLREVRTALRLFTGGVVALAAICILFWLAKTAPPFWHNERSFGPFPNRNQTGNLFGLTAIMILACGQDDIRKSRQRWIFWGAALALMVAAIIINFSRAGIGILVAGSALWLGIFSLRQRSPSRIALVVSFLLLLLTALLLFGGQTLERFHLRNLANAGISNDFRWRIFSDVFQLIRDSPWVGIALGNFEDVFAIFRAASFSDRRAIHPESDWLWLWSELGWVAVALVIRGLV